MILGHCNSKKWLSSWCYDDFFSNSNAVAPIAVVAAAACHCYCWDCCCWYCCCNSGGGGDSGSSDASRVTVSLLYPRLSERIRICPQILWLISWTICELWLRQSPMCTWHSVLKHDHLTPHPHMNCVCLTTQDTITKHLAANCAGSVSKAGSEISSKLRDLTVMLLLLHDNLSLGILWYWE